MAHSRLDNLPKYYRPKMILHPKILEALFKNQREISLKLSNIKGLFKIEHIAMIILTPDDEIIVFSSTPAVEFNLIEKNLWQFDESFKPHHHRDGSFFWWEEAYANGYREKIKEIKQSSYRFTVGFCLARKINKEHIVFSYATRSRDKNIKEYYENHTKELLTMSDYVFGLIQNVYVKYRISAEQRNNHHLKLMVFDN